MPAAPFYYHPRILEYEWSPRHPLRPERLRRAVELLGRYGVVPIDPGLGDLGDVLRVHDPAYAEAVRSIADRVAEGRPAGPDERRFGFGNMDNPPFGAMYRTSLAYMAATARAAEAVRDGAPLAFGLAGGLHHAQRDHASGFCVFNDPAAALHILLERFVRVAYVDIDVHHGDGVQWMWYDDPRVLTVSIHEEGRTLFPGTGGLEETGAEFTSLNIPLQAKTSGDVWLKAFLAVVPPALERFGPQAIVLQLGTDTHHLDPLGHLKCIAQDWLGAVEAVMGNGVPIVAVGGGGYNLTTVPRMWAAAVLTLMELPFDRVPEDLALAWDMPEFLDPEPASTGVGRAHAEAVVDRLTHHHLPFIPRG